MTIMKCDVCSNESSKVEVDNLYGTYLTSETSTINEQIDMGYLKTNYETIERYKHFVPYDVILCEKCINKEINKVKNKRKVWLIICYVLGGFFLLGAISNSIMVAIEPSLKVEGEGSPWLVVLLFLIVILILTFKKDSQEKKDEKKINLFVQVARRKLPSNCNTWIYDTKYEEIKNKHGYNVY